MNLLKKLLTEIRNLGLLCQRCCFRVWGIGASKGPVHQPDLTGSIQNHVPRRNVLVCENKDEEVERRNILSRVPRPLHMASL